MKNITDQIKEAINVDALWSVSDFFYYKELLDGNGFEISHWKGEENWATLLQDDVLIAYIWHKYPLIFIKQGRADAIKTATEKLGYIIIIESEDLTGQEFTIDRDEDLLNRINLEFDKKSFSANEFWFHTVS